ncbi:thioredoxin family protein [Pseudobacter ginsenosidimutans]|uniref:Thioredoxin-related protein n=1 Tax=Pseudobacter ginsenosidimutans TaxID=661488 RepID=A0A4Q7N284_9BACT|nr:thioredoxin family protein [Pseudobacter ginsenosidimutans]QEC43463.1 thioredoxin family protein [Pseudobacter ginsenosidimutans]RZS74849.1 thioredoxin-related protein [Pseudobacter ginsenosidimutans]
MKLFKYQQNTWLVAFALIGLVVSCSDAGTGSTSYGNISIADLPVKEEEQEYLATSQVHFIANPDWQKVIALAKKEKKSIYLFGYSKGCPGCEMMKKRVFISKDVADLIHANYIPVIADLSSTSPVKNDWEKKVDEFKQQLRINSFPINIIFDPEGRPLTRFGGVGSDPAKMIGAIQSSKEEKNQYYVQLSRFNADSASELSARKMIMFSRSVFDGDVTDSLLRIYLRNEKDLFTAEKIQFIGELLGSPQDTAVKVILDNREKIRSLENGYKAIRRAMILRISSRYSFISNMQEDEMNGKKHPDEFYARQIREYFPDYAAYAGELVMNTRMRAIYKRQNSPMFEAYSLQYLDKYGKEIDYATLLQCVQDLIDVAKKEETMAVLDGWCDYLLRHYRNVNVMVAKAYVLSKMGKTDQAKSFLAKERAGLSDPGQRAFIDSLKL